MYTLVLLLSTNTLLISQCDTGCDVLCVNQLNLSLNESCEATITPDMGGIGIAAGDPCYSVIVKDEHGRAIADNLVTIDFLNQNLTYEVTELECGNLCWGNIQVEYKLAPQIDCPPDLTIACNALDFMDLPSATGGCAAFTVQLYSEEKVHLDCDPLFQTYVDRTYRVDDTFGNFSTCSHRVFLERVPLDDIIFPGPAVISCSDTNFQFNEDGNPIPWYFQSPTGSGTAMGIPLLCGIDFPTGFTCSTMTGSGTAAVPLIPSGGAVVIIETDDPDNPDIQFIPDSNADLLCNAVLLFNDVTIPSPNSCSRKIARTWEVFEWWCNQEIPITSLQLIEIVDDRPPVFDCPAPQIVTTTDDCAASVYLPGVTATDECGVDVSIRILIGNTAINTNGGFASLDSGPNVVTYTASDNCGNSSSCQTVFTVQDLTEPVAICNRNKVVSLSGGFASRVPAEVFDNGSFDDCSLDRIEVRRMDNVCTPIDTVFSNYVEFCCEDANKSDLMVAFRVSDKSGNTSLCMVAVEVQDKSIPNMTCPDDITIDCTETYDINNLGQSFGTPILDSNCASTQIPKVDVNSNVTQCGVGNITRTFTLNDGSGVPIRTCKQAITITNNDPFTFSQINFPQDIELTDVCNLDGTHPDLLPDLHGYPTFDVLSGQCALLGFDFTDKVFSPDALGGGQSGECVVIERSWTVVDWCSTGNGISGRYTSPRPQIIKIVNTVAPQLDDGSAIIVESQNGNCNSGEILIVRSAIDDCANNLDFTYSLKTFPEGNIVQMGTTNRIEGRFNAGEYTIDWSVSDGCGNRDTDVQRLSIVSSKAPTPLCHNGLSASLIGWDTDGDGVVDTEQVELWATDFDAGSYPGCNNDIALSFSRDTTDKVRLFSCNDLGRQDIQLWATDVVSGAQDFCLGFIDIQDNGNCGGGMRATLVGAVRTENEQFVTGVEVALRGTSEMQITDLTGDYAFENMPIGGSYVVEPRLDEYYLNGVSTIDLIRIQRHILGLELLDSPYKLIAADINNSSSINGLDLVELRKLILGIYTELPDNESWRFVHSEFEFIDARNPWLEAFDEFYVIDNLSTNVDIDFIGVKVGDVNDSVDATSGRGRIEDADEGNVVFAQRHKHFADDDIAKIVISNQAAFAIQGWQGTLEFDPSALEILDVNPLEADVSLENNFYIGKQEEGWITMSYNSRDGSSVVDADLFELVVRTKKNVPSSEDLLSISSSHLHAQAYGSEEETLSLDIMTNSIKKSEIVTVSPNPWINSADVIISMSHTAECYLEFYNTNGQLLYNDLRIMKEGLSEYRLDKSKVNTTGLVYIRMTVDGEISEYRMMVY